MKKHNCYLKSTYYYLKTHKMGTLFAIFLFVIFVLAFLDLFFVDFFNNGHLKFYKPNHAIVYELPHQCHSHQYYSNYNHYQYNLHNNNYDHNHNYYLNSLHHYNYFSRSSDSSIVRLHAGALIVLTAALVIVAWVQVNKMRYVSRQNFLLSIDKRFADPVMLKAKQIIHTYSREIIKQKKFPVYAKDYLLTPDIATKILHASELYQTYEELTFAKTNINPDFGCLLNFLDFLETIAYFANKNNVSKKEVEELLGNSLCYYYKCFKLFIARRRETSDDHNYYCELEKLYHSIKLEKF